MTLYLITRKDEVGYDEYNALLIASSNADDALDVAKKASRMFEDSYWNIPEIIGDAVEGTPLNKIIISDFNAG